VEEISYIWEVENQNPFNKDHISRVDCDILAFTPEGRMHITQLDISRPLPAKTHEADFYLALAL